MNVVSSDLSLVGLRTFNRPVLASFNYDVGTMTANWRFTNWALGDHYAINLRDSVTDVEGNALDGEWVNPQSLYTTNSAVSEFPSGNGTAGGDFNFVATLLPGDANLNAIIDPADMSIVGMNWGQSTSLFAAGDFNGDGIVNGNDSTIWMQDWYQNGGTNLETLLILSDLNGDWAVDELDANILWGNYGASNPTQAMGDLNGNGAINLDDLDLMFAQYGLDLNVVS